MENRAFEFLSHQDSECQTLGAFSHNKDGSGYLSPDDTKQNESLPPSLGKNTHLNATVDSYTYLQPREKDSVDAWKTPHTTSADLIRKGQEQDAGKDKSKFGQRNSSYGAA